MFYLEKMIVAVDDNSTADAIAALRKRLVDADESVDETLPVLNPADLMSIDWNIFEHVVSDNSTADAIDVLQKQLAGRDYPTAEDYINEAYFSIATSYYKLLKTDWKAFVPSKLLSAPYYFGSMYGIIREDPGEICTYDSKEFEKDEYRIGYIHNDSYESIKLCEDGCNSYRIFGYYANGCLKLNLSNRNHALFTWLYLEAFTANEIAMFKRTIYSYNGEKYGFRPLDPLLGPPGAPSTGLKDVRIELSENIECI